MFCSIVSHSFLSHFHASSIYSGLFLCPSWCHANSHFCAFSLMLFLLPTFHPQRWGCNPPLSRTLLCPSQPWPPAAHSNRALSSRAVLSVFHSYSLLVWSLQLPWVFLPCVCISSVSLRCKVVLSIQRSETNKAHFSIKNKAFFLSRFPPLHLRNGNGLENSSLGVFSLIWVMQVGKNVHFPKLTNSPSHSSESNSQTSEPSM